MNCRPLNLIALKCRELNDLKCNVLLEGLGHLGYTNSVPLLSESWYDWQTAKFNSTKMQRV